MLGATRLTASTFGVLAAYAGVEHGVGEIRQGFGPPGSIVVESWPDSPAFEPLGGEPAMTIIPSLAVTGVLAIVVSVAVGLWAVRFLAHRRAAETLVGLSAVLLLVGGGFGPPMIGAVAGIMAARIGREARTEPGPATRALARAWPSSLIACVLGYLSLVPGVVMLSGFADFDRAYLTSALIAWSFGALTLAVVSARASDHLLAAGRRRELILRVVPRASSNTNMESEPGAFVDLYWLPVGAGTHLQRFSLILYEGVLAALARRKRTTLLHAALKIGLGDQRFTLEIAPAPGGPNSRHEVTGPVGIRGADRLRVFRYQVCLREGATLPDEEWAVVPALRMSEDADTIARVLALTANVPNYTWGRRRPGHDEMWTSDSCVSWLLCRAEVDAGSTTVPRGCRAPGWASGIKEANG